MTTRCSFDEGGGYLVEGGEARGGGGSSRVHHMPTQNFTSHTSCHGES